MRAAQTVTRFPMIDKFLTYLSHEVVASPQTVKAYGQDLRQLAAWLMGDEPQLADQADFATVTLSDLRTWLGELGQKGLCSRTLRRKAQAVRAFYHYLRKAGLVEKNPALDLSLPKLDKPLPYLVKQEELEPLLSEDHFERAEAEGDWEEYRDTLILDILYSTGLRHAELLALNDGDVRLDSGELKVLGKRRKVRIVPLAPQLAERIRHYRTLRDARFPDNASLPAADRPLLLASKGARLNNRALSRIVRVGLASTSASRKTPHALRHTFATALLRDGAEINSVKELLGHSSLETTQIYTHLSFSELQHNYKLAHPRAAKHENHGSTD